MLETIISLAIVVLVGLLFRTGRRSKIIYRRKVADSDHSYFTNDQPHSSSHTQGPWFTGDNSSDAVSHDTLAFGGGEFGGGGAGESYDTGSGNDWASSDFSGDFSGGSPNDYFSEFSDNSSSDFSSDSSFDSSGSDSSGCDSSGSDATPSSSD